MSGNAACSSERAGFDGRQPMPASSATRLPAERRRHVSSMIRASRARPASVTTLRSPLQRAVLQQRFRGQCLQHRAGQDDAVRDAEAVTEFERRAADDDFLALQFLQCRRVAAQHVGKGHFRDPGRPDAEIDQKGRALFVVLAGEHRSHRGHEFAVQLLTERITADEAVGSDLDIDERRPGMFGELLQRAIDVKGRPVGAGLLEGGQHHRSAGALQRFGEVAVRRRVRGRGEVDIERDVLDVRLSEAAGSVRRAAGAATARRRSCRSTVRRSRSPRYRRWPVATARRTAGRPMRDEARCASRPTGRLPAQSSRKYAADIVSRGHHSGGSSSVVVRLVELMARAVELCR